MLHFCFCNINCNFFYFTQPMSITLQIVLIFKTCYCFILFNNIFSKPRRRRLQYRYRIRIVLVFNYCRCCISKIAIHESDAIKTVFYVNAVILKSQSSVLLKTLLKRITSISNIWETVFKITFQNIFEK